MMRDLENKGISIAVSVPLLHKTHISLVGVVQEFKTATQPLYDNDWLQLEQLLLLQQLKL